MFVTMIFEFKGGAARQQRVAAIHYWRNKA